MRWKVYFIKPQLGKMIVMFQIGFEITNSTVRVFAATNVCPL